MTKQKKSRKSIGRLSRRKGHSFEREVAIMFREFYPNARRHLEYHEIDADGVDIVGTEEFKIQCKRGRKYAAITALDEVTCDRALGDVPVLVTRADERDAVAVLPLSDFLDLLRQRQKVR